MSTQPTPSSMIDVGQTIGNYRITAKLGEGGMGVVYLAEHPVIGKKVAMKAIHPELSRNAEVVSRFINEAKSVNQIGNEHIVDISDFGNTRDGEFYFVMEYLKGESLADRLRRDSVVPVARALAIGAQVADALGASHKHGIVHRDLKPENIFLIARGRNPDFVKVLDFGLAKLIQSEEKVTHKTRTGSVMGTPYYMSPEQCEGKQAIDHRADVYSLGIILFEMLTGKVPFGGEGYGEIIVKHVTHQPPSARVLNPEVPHAVEMVIYHALAKDRDERFQSMQELRTALLDPEAFAASAPAMGLSSDLSSVSRAAAPMARTELDLSLSAPPSTFQQGVGEISDELTLAPNSGRKVVMALMTAVALVGLVIVLLARKKPPTPTMVRAAAAPIVVPAGSTMVGAPRAQPPVRVNFASDPVGATVLRADTGRALGETPLSMEIPYSDEPVEFVLKLEGYEQKTLRIVPNMSMPLSSILRPLPAPDLMAGGPSAAGGASAGTASRTPTRRSGSSSRRPDKRPPVVDEDAVLEPTFQ